jgi:hypothetical protein
MNCKTKLIKAPILSDVIPEFACRPYELAEAYDPEEPDDKAVPRSFGADGQI